MATNYEIDYEDEKFQQVEQEKETALNDINSKYDNMISQSDQFYQDQKDAIQDYADEQSKIQQEQSDFAISQIEQQKQNTEKDYTKEQKGAYADWQKQSNQYGANAEMMAQQGLMGTGYSESSQTSMYNQYQGRVATARESYVQAVQNYDNQITQARLTNNSALAEIAFNALQQQLALSLEGFQYKNSLIEQQIAQQQATEDRYYSRWQDVLNQMNQENQFAESIRQYEQNYEFQMQQFEEQVKQFEQNYQLQTKQYEEGIRQFEEQMAYYREKDAKENAYKIQQLELQKKQLEEEQRQFNKQYQLQQQQFAEQKRQAKVQEKYVYSGGGSGGYTDTPEEDTPKTETKTEEKASTKDALGNSKSTQKKKDYYFSNGYQPRYVNNERLAGIGVTVGEVFGDAYGKALKGQKIWKSANDRYYIWIGDGKRSGTYVEVTSYASKINSKLSWGDKIANIFR